MPFAGATAESRTLVCWELRIHPSGSNVDYQERKATTLAPSVGKSLVSFHLIQSLAKMATPSQSRSSGRKEEDTDCQPSVKKNQ